MEWSYITDLFLFPHCRRSGPGGSACGSPAWTLIWKPWIWTRAGRSVFGPFQGCGGWKLICSASSLCISVFPAVLSGIGSEAGSGLGGPGFYPREPLHGQQTLSASGWVLPAPAQRLRRGARTCSEAQALRLRGSEFLASLGFLLSSPPFPFGFQPIDPMWPCLVDSLFRKWKLFHSDFEPRGQY